ncbi:MAG: hypothetical protein E7Z89_03150 [Cyanobacteria bacterium SIG28]|nr:hypothetical protein [Cyanobacteria bacterium SIG28]
MKINGISSVKESNHNVFKSKRIDKNTIMQLAKNNPYSLTEPNQRYISNAIENLSKVKGVKNIKFLLNVAAQNKYTTNIKLETQPKTNWTEKLLAAASAVIAITPFVSKSVKEKAEKIKQNEKLKPIEIEILKSKDELIASVDLKQIEKETKGTTKDFKKNLDYFVVSSETTLEHKKYVLDRLNYMMSDEYEINPQLANKKSIVAAEMINDMAINVPGNEVPNIKAVNQKQHGMCAAISIVRKKLAYEDKPNYVDSILSELDSKDVMSVYDRTKLGTGQKVNVRKVAVDFDTALANGYRIIDASTMHWMQIATMTGAINSSYEKYTPFDKENFDVNTDTFFNGEFQDEKLQKTHVYYQSLMKAKEVIGKYKARTLKNKEKSSQKKLSQSEDIKTLAEVSSRIREKLSLVLPETSSEVASKVLNLKHSHSDKLPKNNPFVYIPNEEEAIKKDKIKEFISSNSTDKNIDKKTLDEIADLVIFYNELSDQGTSSGLNGKIREAKELYEVGAAYRYQIVKALEDPKTLETIMINEGVATKEDLVINTVELLIDELQKDSEDADAIVAHIANYLNSEIENPTKEDILSCLVDLYNTSVALIEEELEDVYKKFGYKNGSRDVIKESLYSLAKTAQTGKKSEVEEIASRFGINPDRRNVVEKIDQLIVEIDEASDDKVIKLYTLLGKTSLVDMAAKTFENFVKEVASSENTEECEVLNRFLETNNINHDDAEAFQASLNEIKNTINNIGNFFQAYTIILTITDKDGEIITSPNPKEAILDRLEKEGRVPAQKDLKILQEHFTKITKDRSSDEFHSRRTGKLKDKSLYKFSKQEEQTLENIKKSINPMYDYVQKELKRIYPEIKENIEQINHDIGLENGEHWHSEGSSGLHKSQEVKILEYMTGRQYYETKDIKKAIEKIKTSPYSGISTSSVFHDKHGWHAQYIADIAPTEISKKDKDGNIKTEAKEILYHDNTWGAAEFENTWTDSNGELRTDYSDNRGGSLGYITNSKLQNGNYVDRILNDMILNVGVDKTENKVYKRITHSKAEEAYRSPQYKGIILEGKAPELKDLAAHIHDTVFVPSRTYLYELEEYIKNKKMTVKDIEEKINLHKNIGDNWEATYEELTKRILPSPQKKMTQDEYEKLADNDYLKVVLEKIALKQTYKISDLSEAISRVQTVSELERFKKGIKARALSDFRLAFGKDKNILFSLANRFRIKQNVELEKIYKRYHLDLSEKAKNEIVSHFSIDNDMFNGSVKDTLELIIKDQNEVIDKHIKHSIANHKVKEYFENYLKRSTYFAQADFKDESIVHIIKFIDRVFDPADDKEFIKIFRRIQDMTDTEFKKEILPKVTDEDLGIKMVTGFDIAKEIQRSNEKFENKLRNQIYEDNMVQTLPKEPSLESNYRYKKFHRENFYRISENNFNHKYRNLQNELYLLEIPKIVNKYRQSNFERYGAYPAFPKVDLIDDKLIKDSLEVIDDGLKENIEIIKQLKNQISVYETINFLEDFTKDFEDNKTLNSSELETIKDILTDFVEKNKDDKSLDNAILMAEIIMELPTNLSWDKYKELLEPIIEKIHSIERSGPAEALSAEIDNKINTINDIERQFILTVQKKYKSHIRELVNNLRQAYIKEDETAINDCLSKLQKDYVKMQLLNNPQEVLDTALKTYAIDYGKRADHPEEKVADKAILQSYLGRSLNFAYLADIQEIVMDATNDSTAVKAKHGFKDFVIGINALKLYDMASDEIIASIINTMLFEDNHKTALLFIEKLGLGEGFVNSVIDKFKLEEFEKDVKETSKLINDFGSFKTEISDKIKETISLLDDNNTNAQEILDEFEKSIIFASNKYTVKKDTIEDFLSAVKSLKGEFEKNPHKDKALVFASIISLVGSSVDHRFNNMLQSFNDKLEQNQKLVELINEIVMNEDSKAHKKRKEFSTKFYNTLTKHIEEGNLQALQESDTI